MMWTKKFRTFFQLAGCLTVGLLAVYGLLMVFSSGSPAWAAIGQAIPNLQASPRVPNVLTYQGILRQPDGTPLDGTYEMTFRLYDDPSGGDLKHEETISNVVVRDGLFTVLLGDTTAIDADAFKDPLYISVQVGTGQEMVPRQRIAPVAYAVQLTDGVYVDETGLVGIGTTDPQSQLDVNGDLIVSGNLDGGGTLNVTDHLSVTGDISWHGSLKSMTYPSYFGALAEPSTPDKKDEHDTHIGDTDGICFIAHVGFLGCDDNGEWCRCYVWIKDNTWWVGASTLRGESTAECGFLCLEW